MRFEVRLTPDAAWDLERLAKFLVDKSPSAALKAADTLIDGVLSLEIFPSRGRLLEDGRRELVIPFGRYAYIVEYRADEESVVVSRIRHSHEPRSGPSR